jgi:hypothetical protein
LIVLVKDVWGRGVVEFARHDAICFTRFFLPFWSKKTALLGRERAKQLVPLRALKKKNSENW